MTGVWTPSPVCENGVSVYPSVPPHVVYVPREEAINTGAFRLDDEGLPFAAKRQGGGFADFAVSIVNRSKRLGTSNGQQVRPLRP